MRYFYAVAAVSVDNRIRPDIPHGTSWAGNPNSTLQSYLVLTKEKLDGLEPLTGDALVAAALAHNLDPDRLHEWRAGGVR